MSTVNHMTVALPEATVIELAQHALPGELLADVIARLVSTQSPVEITPPISTVGIQSRYAVSVLGVEESCATLTDALAYALTKLAELDGAFLDQLSKGGGRKRPYVAPSRDGVHPDRSDLNQKYARELWLGAGWWISTNSSKADVTRILKAACDVANLKFGTDVVFSNR